MSRLGCLAFFALSSMAFAIASADPPEDAKINNLLAVQRAMVRARTFLNEMQPRQAVEMLEEQLPKVSNNPQYLSLLREAYRSYIRDLQIAGDAGAAQRYFDRLCILDPAAAKDTELRPKVEASPRPPEAQQAKEKKSTFPNFKIPDLPSLFGKQVEKEEKKGPLPKATIRAHGDDSIGEDPFDRKNQREMKPDTARSTAAREWLSRGAAEFQMKRYAEARQCFEQAYQNEPASLDSCREQWAYCILQGVALAMEQPGILPARLPELQKQVDGAIQLAPTKMMKVGQELHQTLDQRAKLSPVVRGAGGQIPFDVPVQASHLGKNKEGWEVTKTKHFLIFHKQNQELAERAANIAETTRTTMYRKWFGAESMTWDAPCELVLHPSATSYTNMTGVPNQSPGHTKIESDPSGRVVYRGLHLRMDLNDALAAVLPHEATHVVLAGMFNVNHVPRWADEGIAVLSEPNEKIDLHRRKLLVHNKEGTLFGLKELMELPDYPQPRRIGAFYAQSVVLVEFLTQQKGPKVLTDFIRDGLRHGYENALQRHYGMTFVQLDQLWQQQVISNTERYSARK